MSLETSNYLQFTAVFRLIPGTSCANLSSSADMPGGYTPASSFLHGVSENSSSEQGIHHVTPGLRWDIGRAAIAGKASTMLDMVSVLPSVLPSVASTEHGAGSTEHARRGTKASTVRAGIRG